MHRISTSLLSVAASILAISSLAQQPMQYTIVERGPNHRVLVGPADPVTGQPQARIVELQSGMHYWSPASNDWAVSQPRLVETEQGFVAPRLQHATYLAPDIFVRGAVAFRLPETGGTVRATPVGIGLYNRVSGDFQLIGTVTNSAGYIAGPESTTLVYPNCFAGVCASVVYRIAHASLEQDLIFTANLDASDWGFPTNNNTLVQILTEIYEGPAPDISQTAIYTETNAAIRASMVSPDIIDETLTFDPRLFIGPGHAYTSPSIANTNGTSTPVHKRYVQNQDGRIYLVESVPYGNLRDALAALPDCLPPGAQGNVRKFLPSSYASIPRPPKEVATSEAAMPRKVAGQLAMARSVPAGVIIDWPVTVTANWPLFQSDTTYVVAGTVNISVPTTIEGGTVLKYKKNANAKLVISSTLKSTATAFRPAFFTAYDDDTIGSAPQDSLHTPSGNYANPAISMGQTSLSVTNFRFRYAQIGIQYAGSSTPTVNVTHSQFYKCVQALSMGGGPSGSGSAAASLALNNVLFVQTTPCVLSSPAYNLNLTLLNCTIDQGNQVVGGSLGKSGSASILSTNTIFSSITTSGLGIFIGGNNAFYNNYNNWSFGNPKQVLSSSPYATQVIWGSHYLPSGSQLWNAGASIGIPAWLLADLSARTTDPPVPLTGPINSSTVLSPSPQVRRDTAAPEIGYHFDAVDFCAQPIDLSVSLTLNSGVVIGTSGDYAFNLLSGASISSAGLPKALNRVCYLGNVQELPPAAGAAKCLQLTANRGQTDLGFRFTEFSMPPGQVSVPLLSTANGAYPIGNLWFRDCQLRGCDLTLTFPTSFDTTTIGITNNVLERCTISLTRNGGTVSAYQYNNTFHGGSLTLANNNAPNTVWYAHDNLFEGCIQSKTGTQIDSANNGFSGVSDGLSTASPQLNLAADYQNGPLGPFYLPSSGSSPSLYMLVNHGSRGACDAGLFHFTTQTSVGNRDDSSVDIGFHYPAVDVNAVPLDLDLNGTPDCLQPGPLITLPPQSQTVFGQANATFSVGAIGCPDLNYQWYHNGAQVVGASTSSLALNGVDLGDSGNYNALIYNSDGSTFSPAAALTVQKVATPNFSPSGDVYSAPQSVAISCATPGAVIHYRLDGQEPIQTDATYTSPIPVSQNLTLKAKAWYSNWTMSDTEAEAYHVDGTGHAPTVTVSPPTGTTVPASQDLEILVETSDIDGAITKIELLCNGSKIGSSTSSPLRYTLARMFSGTYTFTARAIDNDGFITLSSPVLYTVTASGPVVSLYGQTPMFTSSPGTLLASVYGINPGTLRSLTLNGSPLPLDTGNFSLSTGLVEGNNVFTLSATDTQSRSGQTTTTVSLDSIAPVIVITAPANGSSFVTSRINVSGTVTETSLKRIDVNGVTAFVTGGSWQALNVPIGVGVNANTITATAEDLSGNKATASITVTGTTDGGGNQVESVQLTATPVGGFAPLQVTFNVTAPNVPGTIQSVSYDFNGDIISDQTETDLHQITHTYSSAGEYFPVVTLVTTAGSFSSLGGWSGDLSRVRVNVQAPPVQIGTAISVTDPIDIKWIPSGRLYVLSRSTATITEYDVTQAAPIVIRSVSGIGTTPTGLDVDSAGNVYVAESGHHQVAKYQPMSGSFQLDTTFGNNGRIGKNDQTPGSGDGEFSTPFDVAVSADGQDIAVSDSGNHRIQVFTTSGLFVVAFGEFGTGLGQFNSPKGLTFDRFGTLHIIDSGNNRLDLAKVFGVIGTSGAVGTALGQFQDPVNIGVGSRGVYIADKGNNRIEKFDQAGLGQTALTPLNPRWALSTDLGLSQSCSVAPAEDLFEERIYVADTGNNRVLLTKLPGSPSDDPLAVWNIVKQRLLAGDIAGALPYFASVSAGKYHDAFLSIGTTDLAADMSQIGALTPVFIDVGNAQYRFDQVLGGFTITFLVDFVLENGTWKIMAF